MTCSAFCIPGGHSVPVEDAGLLPEGWQLVKASVIPNPHNEVKVDPVTGVEYVEDWQPGVWFVDEQSPSSIPVCPEHLSALLDNGIIDVQLADERASWYADGIVLFDCPGDLAHCEARTPPVP